MRQLRAPRGTGPPRWRRPGPGWAWTGPSWNATWNGWRASCGGIPGPRSSRPGPWPRRSRNRSWRRLAWPRWCCWGWCWSPCPSRSSPGRVRGIRSAGSWRGSRWPPPRYRSSWCDRAAGRPGGVDPLAAGAVGSWCGSHGVGEPRLPGDAGAVAVAGVFRVLDPSRPGPGGHPRRRPLRARGGTGGPDAATGAVQAPAAVGGSRRPAACSRRRSPTCWVGPWWSRP